MRQPLGVSMVEPRSGCSTPCCLPLPNNNESDSDPSQSHFGDQEEESQSSFPALQTIAQDGEVPSDTGGVTNTPSVMYNPSRPNEEMRSHQHPS